MLKGKKGSDWRKYSENACERGKCNQSSLWETVALKSWNESLRIIWQIGSKNGKPLAESTRNSYIANFGKIFKFMKDKGESWPATDTGFKELLDRFIEEKPAIALAGGGTKEQARSRFLTLFAHAQRAQASAAKAAREAASSSSAAPAAPNPRALRQRVETEHALALERFETKSRNDQLSQIKDAERDGVLVIRSPHGVPIRITGEDLKALLEIMKEQRKR